MSTNQYIIARKLAIGTPILSNDYTFSVSGHDAMLLPSGNTAQRPSNSQGLFRYNATLNTIEWNDGTQWIQPVDGDGFIQNRFASQQPTSDFWISGSGRVDDYLQVEDAGRLVKDSTGILSIASDSDSSIGDNLRLRRLNFFTDTPSFYDVVSDAYISSPDEDTIVLTAAKTTFTSLDVNNTAPTTVGTTKLVISDENGTLSFSRSLTVSNSSLTIGESATSRGTIILTGNTSGAITIQPQAAAGTFNFNLPITAGTTGHLLTSAGGGSNAMTWTDPSSFGLSDGDKGDITVSSSGTVWTVDNDAITYAKIQNVSATNRFLGRITSGAGDTEELTGTQATTLLDAFTTSLKGLAPASGGGTTNYLRADGTWASPPGAGLSDGDKGDITVSSSGATWTIDNDVVTYAKMQNVSATSRFLGRITSGAGDTEELTGTQATTLLDAFTSGLKGLTPASGGGTTNFLRADGSWAVPVDTTYSFTSPLVNSSGTVSINNAAADGSTKGAAAFNSTNFSASSGVINTIQNIHTAATPQFARMGLGAASASVSALYLAGTFIESAQYIASTITPGVNANGYGVLATPSFTKNSSGTHTTFASIYASAPSITGGAATLTRTATVYISGASGATVTDKNYSLYIAGGDVYLGGPVEVDAALDVNNTVTASGFTSSGDVEVTNSASGIILRDAGDASRRRITVVNGVLTVSAPL